MIALSAIHCSVYQGKMTTWHLIQCLGLLYFLQWFCILWSFPSSYWQHENIEDKNHSIPWYRCRFLPHKYKYLFSFRNISNGVISGSALTTSSSSSSVPFFSRSWAPFCFKAAMKQKDNSFLSTVSKSTGRVVISYIRVFLPLSCQKKKKLLPQVSTSFLW